MLNETGKNVDIEIVIGQWKAMLVLVPLWLAISFKPLCQINQIWTQWRRRELSAAGKIITANTLLTEICYKNFELPL